MSGRLQGKRALITGAAQGLGAAMAEQFAAEGARVLLTDLNADKVATVAEKINAQHGADSAFYCPHDVTSEADWAKALEQAAAQLGGLSVLVNNAGIGHSGLIEQTELATWRQVMAVNADGVFLGCKMALPLLRDSQPASIINISSIAGLIADPYMAAYNASKAACWMLSKSVALYCARKGWDIRCNSIHPAFTDTAILEDLINSSDMTRDVLLGKLAKGNPQGRVAEPVEIALGAVYLASDESRFMTGAEIKLDGGVSAM